MRAQIVLLAAAGYGNSAIARAVGATRKTSWRGRFARDRLDGLSDGPHNHSGCPGAEEPDHRLGRERGDALEGILGNIEQTFGGQPLYPSVEERAAALLYFIIKDHPFSDGNKRIGSLLFVHYLVKNECLNRPDGSQRFELQCPLEAR